MIIHARVKTGKSKFSVLKGDTWAINVTSKPEQNAANIEIIRELSKEYKKVRIIRGLKSRKKVIEIAL